MANWPGVAGNDVSKKKVFVVGFSFTIFFIRTAGINSYGSTNLKRLLSGGRADFETMSISSFTNNFIREFPMSVGMAQLSRKVLFTTAAGIILLFLLVAYLNTHTDGKRTSVATIALYSQNVWQQGFEPLKEMLESLGYSFVSITAEDINEGRLEGFNILLIPGGSPANYSHDITSQGKENVRKFIRDGGAYIGICGGSLFASGKNNLNLIDGEVSESSNLDIQGTCVVQIADHTHPVTQASLNSFKIYCTGIVIYPEEGSDVAVIGTYEANGKDAMVAFEYGKGRVFLFGPHPEFDQANWEFARRVLQWCLKETVALL